MHLEKLSFGFFLVLALALNAVFLVGTIDNPQHHNEWVLTFAIVSGMFAAAIKLGDRSHVGAVLLSSTVVAVLLLVAGRIMWIVANGDQAEGESSALTVHIVALGYGGLVAYIVAVITFVGDTLMSRR